MKKLATAAGLIALGLTLAPTPAHPQDIEHGLWSGALTPPGAEPVAVTFQVSERDGGLTIVMSNPQLGPMEFADEELAGDELTFWWDAGVRVDCTLTRQYDGAFEGPCSDGSGSDGVGTIMMTPPAE